MLLGQQAWVRCLRVKRLRPHYPFKRQLPLPGAKLPTCPAPLFALADEPTFLQARHSLELPPSPAPPPPGVVVMPDAEVRGGAVAPHYCLAGGACCSVDTSCRAARSKPPRPPLPPAPQVEIAVSERHKAAGQAQHAAAADAVADDAGSTHHAPILWVVHADQRHAPAPDSPLSSGSGSGGLPSPRPADGQTVALLHAAAPRAGMQRRQRAAPSNSFVYTI